MNAKILNLALLALLLLPAGGARPQSGEKRPCPEPQEAKDSKFHPGQVWNYKTRPNEQKSTLTILKIESLPKLGVIVHIRVDDIRLHNCTGGPEPNNFAHMPFTRDAIERSVVKVAKEDGPVPDFNEGYDEWRRACGGVYTITVAEAIEVSEKGFNERLGCKTSN
ncbi:MAG: hypothetical protein WAN72_12965 [Candidatus Acidiferrales bacterium]